MNMDSEIYDVHPDILMITKSQVEIADGFPVTTPTSARTTKSYIFILVRTVEL
ncbi:hypothetical protein LR48_Vigan05g075200 [Vigna angularis]|uniref:Uncharacterized protein n=1 Tax=Phaseolus angularis TaxID=3914 RepID=A0A0L9UK56_PHAAN|nr:hypothetical protein LR48_Vigan05g075200 [Vigna angularis]